MRFPLIATALVLAAVLLAAPPLTAERPAPEATAGEPHEIKRPGRDIVEYTSDRLQVVAVHYYFPEDNDPKWPQVAAPRRRDGRPVGRFDPGGAPRLLHRGSGRFARAAEHPARPFGGPTGS